MKIYVATAWTNAGEARLLNAKAVEMGHEILSTWADTQDVIDPIHSMTQEQLRGIDELNCAHVRASDVVVFLHHPLCGQSWRELFYAIDQEKIVYVVGVRTMPAFGHENVKQCADLRDVILELRELRDLENSPPSDQVDTVRSIPAAPLVIDESSDFGEWT